MNYCLCLKHRLDSIHPQKVKVQRITLSLFISPGTDMPAVVQLARKLHADRIEELKQELKHNEELIL